MIGMWRKLGEGDRGISFRRSSVVSDEKYRDLCRITAEKFDAGHIAVVCSIRGGRIRSFAFDEEEFSVLFPRMKRELADLLDRELEAEEKEAELERLFAEYTTAKIYKRSLLGEER